ncbi:MAG: ABC transporter permease, partial [Opitutaceae bacterium]
MSNNLRIAFRFLTAKKRAMLMSLACIVLGVGLFIVTQATTTGIEKLFSRAIVGADGAISIEDEIQFTLRTITAEALNGRGQQAEGQKFIPGIDEPALVKEALEKFDSISAMSQVLRGTVNVSSSFKNENARQVYGIDLDDHRRISGLDRQIVFGSLADFEARPGGALIGRELADRLELQVGDSFSIEAQNRWHPFRVCAIYQTGISDYDKLRIFIHLDEARSLLRRPSGVTLIQIQLHDAGRAVEVARHIEQSIGYTAKPWQVREQV